MVFGPVAVVPNERPGDAQSAAPATNQYDDLESPAFEFSCLSLGNMDVCSAPWVLLARTGCRTEHYKPLVRPHGR